MAEGGLTSINDGSDADFDMTENKEHREQNITTNSFKVKSKKEIDVKMENDKHDCYISDICQLPDGTIILTDCWNQKIKRLDMDDKMNYNIKDHCDLDADPTDICCTGQNEVAVKMNNDKVQFISVTSSLSKPRQESIEGGGFLGMTCLDGELWISTEEGVKVYSSFRTPPKTIKDPNVPGIFRSSPLITCMAVSGETVILTDGSNGAFCLGKDGAVRGELHDDRLVVTRGICVSGDGTVFLSGVESNNIVMFDKNGECLGELVDKDEGLVEPISLCYDDKKNCLIVSCFNSNKIVEFNMSC